MKIIISPAKKMNVDTDSLPIDSLPPFLPQTERLLSALQTMSPKELQSLWKCNDNLAQLNIERLKAMTLRQNLTPAILSYEGIQYRYIAPGVMSAGQLEYLREHLRILSGFYGLLRPFDGVTPYRLEMQAKLSVDGAKDLYALTNMTNNPIHTIPEISTFNAPSNLPTIHWTQSTPHIQRVFMTTTQ